MKTTTPPPLPPEDLIHSLLATVRNQFCSDMTISDWSKHQHFIRRNVLLWPARFMVQKGFTLPGPRYEKILRSIFQEIIANGKTDAVKFWPGYLMKCVQDHFHHHWEEYYQEAKSVRTMAETYALRCQVSPSVEDPTVESLAMAHQVLTARSRRRCTPSAPAQKLLFR